MSVYKYSIDGASDAGSETSSWSRGLTYAAPDKLEIAAMRLVASLKNSGFTTRLNFLSGSPEDIANTFNCISFLLQRIHQEKEKNELTNMEVRKLKNEAQVAETQILKLKKDLEAKEKDIGSLMIRERATMAALTEEVVRLNREKDELQKKCGNLCRIQVQFQHEVRRWETEYCRLQDALRKYLAEKKKESKANMEIVGLLKQQSQEEIQKNKGKPVSKNEDPTPVKNSNGKKVNKAKLDDGTVQVIVRAYEEKQRDLQSQVRDLTSSLESLQKEHSLLINSQIRQSVRISSTSAFEQPHPNSCDSIKSPASPLLTTTPVPVREQALQCLTASHSYDGDSFKQQQLGEEEEEAQYEERGGERVRVFEEGMWKNRNVGGGESSVEALEENGFMTSRTNNEAADDTMYTEIIKDAVEVEEKERGWERDEKGQIVPWPLNEEVQNKRSQIMQNLNFEGTAEYEGPRNHKTEEEGLDSVSGRGISNDDTVENENNNITMHLSTVTEGVEDADDGDTEAESVKNTIVSKESDFPISAISFVKDSDEESREILLDKSVSFSTFLPPIAQDDDHDEGLERKENKEDLKINTKVKIADTKSNTNSPFELPPPIEIEVTGKLAGKVVWPPPQASTSSTPSGAKAGASAFRPAFGKLPQPSIKPLPNPAHLSEKQLKNELRLRAAEVEETVRALKNACASIRPEDMRSVMERRMLVELSMAANIAEQQEAVVNLALVGLDKALRHIPDVGDLRNLETNQFFCETLEKAEGLARQLYEYITDEIETCDKEPYAKIAYQLQESIAEIYTRVEMVKREIEATSPQPQDFRRSSTSSRILDKNITSLRERADDLTKKAVLIVQDRLNFGNRSTTPENQLSEANPRRRATWEEKALEEKAAIRKKAKEKLEQSIERNDPIDESISEEGEEANKSLSLKFMEVEETEIAATHQAQNGRPPRRAFH